MGEKAPGRNTRRRHDSETTRAQILSAATDLFTADGYDGVSLRKIAAAVGLDAAMLIRHFGSKDRLFAAAMRRPELLQDILAGSDRDTMGERLVRYCLNLDEHSREYHMLIALVRSNDSNPSADSINEIAGENVGIIAHWLGGDNAEIRAGLICSYITGCFLMRSVFRNAALSTANVDEIVSLTAPIIQALIDR